MAALESRDPKRSITKDAVVRTFERGFEACGTTMEEVRKELEWGRVMDVQPPSFPDAARVVELAVRDLTEREAVLDRARLLDQAVRVSGGGLRSRAQRCHRREE